MRGLSGDGKEPGRFPKESKVPQKHSLSRGVKWSNCQPRNKRLFKVRGNKLFGNP